MLTISGAVRGLTHGAQTCLKGAGSAA